METLTIILEMFFGTLMTVIAAWRRSWLYYVPAGLLWIYLGFSYYSSDSLFALLMVFFGAICLIGAGCDKA